MNPKKNSILMRRSSRQVQKNSIQHYEEGIDAVELRDAREIYEDVKSDTSLAAIISGTARAARSHQRKSTVIMYRNSEKKLDMILAGKLSAAREEINHWLLQGGFLLRQETAAVALSEFRKLDASVIDFMKDHFKQATELHVQAEKIEVGFMRDRVQEQIERHVDSAMDFCDDLIDNFKAMIEEQV